MSKTNSIIGFICFPIVAALFAGCGGNSVEDRMYGTWELSAFYSNEDFRKAAEQPIPEGAEMEMTMRGSQSYHKGGKYSGEVEVTLRLKTAESEFPLRFYLKDAGEWSVHADGKELVETTTDGTFTPLDELTKKFLEESPDLFASLTPIKGETTTSQILSVSESTLEIQSSDSKLKFVLTKKQ